MARINIQDGWLIEENDHNFKPKTYYSLEEAQQSCVIDYPSQERCAYPIRIIHVVDNKIVASVNVIVSNHSTTFDSIQRSNNPEPFNFR